MDSQDRLFDLLAAYEKPGVFNQYRDVHPGLDRPGAAAIRRHNLRRYLEAFAGARFVLVGEAAGYAGCRFSGIPFTCEAQWTGDQPLAWTADVDLARSSAASEPWTERSASMVWEILEGRPDCVLWNAFPWHPFEVGGPLSNRRPGRDLWDGLEALKCLLSIFPAAEPYAVGRVAERALERIGVDAAYIRHPSHGGKKKFQAGVRALRSNCSASQCVL
jgi:hypothetical protein